MRGRYARRSNYSRSSRRNRYSIERTVFNTEFNSVPPFTNQTTDIVPASNIQGMRKAKNFTIDILADISGGALSGSNSFGYVVYYLPAGATLVLPNWAQATGDLMPTNQNIIMAGVLNTNQTPVRLYSRLARNLQSGDKIVMTLTNIDTAAQLAIRLHGVISYAVTLQ